MCQIRPDDRPGARRAGPGRARKKGKALRMQNICKKEVRGICADTKDCISSGAGHQLVAWGPKELPQLTMTFA